MDWNRRPDPSMNARRPGHRNAAFGAHVLIAIALLGGCGQQRAQPEPGEVTAETTCALDGMLLGDFPGPKAQILYETGETEYYCDTVEMFSMLLKPETGRRVRAVFTQDMARADWAAPHGAWIDARTAWYVHGSDRRGSMGPTFAAFSRREDADAFARSYGGRVLRFDEVTPDLADLRGGAVHDEGM
jgi:copper chaperone NosL